MIYKTEKILLTFSPDMEDYVKSLQKDFMPEDTQTGMIQAFLDNYEEDYVCSTIIYQEVFSSGRHCAEMAIKRDRRSDGQ